jgi:hypothetical protein
VRRAAVAALAGHEGAEVTQALLAASGDDDRDVRQAAEQALAGRDEAEVVQAALAACGDDDWGVREAAIRVLAEAPASWLSLVVLPKLRGGEITPEIVRLFLRSGERDVMGLVQQIASDDTTQVVDLAVEAAKAVGDGNAWPVLAGALRRYKATDDILIDDVPLFRALALMGPTVRQELKLVLGDRRLSDAARAGVIWALGRAGGLQDPEIIGNLMDSMAHGSALVRAAAAQALREVADVLGEWSRPEDLAILEPEARPYVELLLSLMQGHPLTMESIPLVMGTLPTLTPTAETSPSPEDTDDSVGSVWEHLRELGRRIMYCAFAAGLAALLGGGGSNRLLPILARALYDLPPTRLWFRGAPMSAATAWMSALLAALWIGVPMFLYQSWKFGEPGLFPHERRMARPRVKLLALSVLLTPLGIALLARLLALASRLIRLMPADPPLAFGLARLVSDDPTLRVVWTNRLIGVSLVFVFVLVAMRPLWNYALRQVRARYLIELATRKPVFYWMIIIRVLRRAFIWQTINFIFMAICLPVWVLFYFFVANFIILLFIVIGSILIILILRFRGISPFLVIAYTKLALIARYIFFVSTLTIFWPILIDLVITVRPQRLKLAIQNLHLLALEAFGSEEAEVIRESRNAFAQARQ